MELCGGGELAREVGEPDPATSFRRIQEDQVISGQMNKYSFTHPVPVATSAMRASGASGGISGCRRN